MSRETDPALLANARALRKAMTPWERKLWYLYLRNHPVKFYKQRVIDHYIVDFYCPRAKLVIELDGSQHFETERQMCDAARSAHLEALGLTVLRFPNIDIDRRFPAVCETIARGIDRRFAIHQQEVSP